MVTGDFSRLTFDPRKHFSGVLMQQGRVQMDADWNESVAINANGNALQIVDIIGPLGTPMEKHGFEIALMPWDSMDFRIHPGHMYMEGVLTALDAPALVRCT